MVAWLLPSISCSCFSTGCTPDSHQVRKKTCFYIRGEKQSLWGGRRGRRRLLTRHECTSVPRKIQGNVYFFYSFLFPSSSWAVQLSVWDRLTHGFSMRGRAMNLASSIPSRHGPMGENLPAASPVLEGSACLLRCTLAHSLAGVSLQLQILSPVQIFFSESSPLANLLWDRPKTSLSSRPRAGDPQLLVPIT